MGLTPAVQATIREATLRRLRQALFAFFVACIGASLVGAAWITYKFGVSPTALALVVAWAGMAAAAIYCIRLNRWAPALLIILGLRIGMFLVTHGLVTSTPDPHFYDVLARSISHGRDLRIITNGVVLRAHAPRLYSILLGGLFAVSEGSKIAPFILNGLLDLLTALLIYLCARRLDAGATAARLFGALYLLWPSVVVGSAFAVKETLGSPLVLACIWTLLCTSQDGRQRGVQYGLFLGLLGLTQPAWFFMTAAFPLAIALRRRWSDVIRFLVVASLATILVLAPWVARNWVVTGGFVPLTTSTGFNLYTNAAGGLHFPARLNRLPELAWSNGMLAAGWAIIISNPIGYFAHEAKMMFTAFALEHAYYFNLEGLSTPPRISPKDFLPVMQLPLIALWAGAAAFFRSRSAPALMTAIFGIILLHLLTVSIWFEFAARHRAYLLPLLLVCCSTLLERRPVNVAPAEGSNRPGRPSGV
jgi:hypothetical protein